MKICTMTCHHVYNYGATLQAFALQHYLESLGHEVEIIDYRLPSHRRYEWSYIHPEGRLYKLTQKLPFLKWPVYLYRNRIYLKTWGRKREFDKFDSSYLHITDSSYRTIEELKCNPPNADVYIAGSDQIWNPEFPNGKNLGYYLDFGEKTIKRLSYAASFGVSNISIEQEKFVFEQLSKFAYISVREQTGVDILNKIGLISEKCIDPVFLLKKEEWIEALDLNKYDTGKYILVYDFHHEDNSLISFVKRLSMNKGLKIVSVNDMNKAAYADIQINNAGPKQFLNLIINAEYVISNSFHATAFSIIFHKKFATFPLNTLGNRGRMVELINLVGLNYFYEPCNTEIFDNEVCWDSINERIKKEIYKSKEYLNESLKIDLQKIQDNENNVYNTCC